MKKMLFALNPNAGKGTSRNELFKVIDTFIKNGYDVNTYITQKAGELSEIIKDRLAYYDVLTVWGGDGTLNEAINGIIKAGCDKNVLGYIPKGTVNDFASSLKIPKTPEAAAKLICEGKPFVCDCGIFNRRAFSYVAAFGAFTKVSYSTSQAKKKIFSRFAYILDGAASIADIKPIHASVTFNGQTVEDDYVYGMVSNTKSVGGFSIPNLNVNMNDGCLELMLVKMPKNGVEWNSLITSLMNKKFDSPLIRTEKIHTARFEFDVETPWTIDGEFGGDVKIADVNANNSAFKVIVSIDYAQ